MTLLPIVLVVLLALMAVAGLWMWLGRRRQIRFIRKTLSRAARLNGDRRVIAAFSTLPDRIFNLEPTIRCLLNQTRPPDEIVVAVPHFSRRQQRNYLIPEYLEQLPRVRILHCDTDWGPATKFIPVVREELAAGCSDALIMIVDDDRVYPADALETYLFYHQQLPEAALCFRGAPMPTDFIWRRAKMTRGVRIREPRKVAVMTGCGSYLIQPRFFDAQLWDYSNAPLGAFYMDDIWISGCLDRRGIEKYAVPASAMMRTVRQQRGTMTLHDVPEGRQYNNDEAIGFFSDTWKVFAPLSRDRHP
jgi:Glycosyl transferase family 2